MDISQIRSQFSITERYTYLNHSSIGPLTAQVQQAIAQAAVLQGDGSEGNFELKSRVQPLKEKIGQLIHAEQDEIALVRNTVEGLNTVASGVLWNEDDNIVTDNIEFPANIYPWLNQESRYGVKTKLVPARDGKVLAEDLIEACDSHTRVLSVSFVQFSNGYRTDLERIGSFCREQGIYFCVDAIQGLGALQLDVRKCKIDFAAAGSHKWLMGPVGIGFLYIRKEMQAELWPSEIGHLGVMQNTDKYTEYNLTFRPSAEKFEGGVPNYAGVFGFDESLRLFHDVGPGAIEERVLMLTDYLSQEIQERGYRLLSHRSPMEKSGTVTFVSDHYASDNIFARLTKEGIIVSLREGAIRVAPHFYNTTEEIDRLLAILPKHTRVHAPMV